MVILLLLLLLLPTFDFMTMTTVSVINARAYTFAYSRVYSIVIYSIRKQQRN